MYSVFRSQLVTATDKLLAYAQHSQLFEMSHSAIDIEPVVLQSSDNLAGEADRAILFNIQQHGSSGDAFEALQKVKAQSKHNAV